MEKCDGMSWLGFPGLRRLERGWPEDSAAVRTVLGAAPEKSSSLWPSGSSLCSMRTLAGASSASIGVRGWGGSFPPLVRCQF